jgi:hypothetical protein
MRRNDRGVLPGRGDGYGDPANAGVPMIRNYFPGEGPWWLVPLAIVLLIAAVVLL